MSHANVTWGVQTQVVTLPSGSTCVIKTAMELDELIENDLVDVMDRLGLMVQTEHVNRVKTPQDHAKKQLTKAQLEEKTEQDWLEMLRDKEKFSSMAGLVDKIVCIMVVDPVVHYAYTEENGIRTKIPHNQREDGLIYTDTIPFSDRMEIFNKAMTGVKKMESFLPESPKDVGNVADQP